MKDKFGRPPVDGSIYCKVCNEYLCPEDDSLLEGFGGDKPMKSKEVLRNEDTTMSEYFEEKSEHVHLCKTLSHCLRVELEDNDIYEILLSFELINHDVLADERYQLSGISDTDTHPRVKKILNTKKDKKKDESSEKDDKKDKKKKKAEKKRIELELQRFQIFIKQSNEILSLISLISLYIQTAIPAYTLRKDNDYSILSFTNNEWLLKDKIIKSGITYLAKQLKKLCEKKKSDVWSSIQQLFIDDSDDTIDVVDIHEQLIHTLFYMMSPTFSLVLGRIKKYETYSTALICS